MSARTRCVSCRWLLPEGARFWARCGIAVHVAWHVAATAMPAPPPRDPVGPRRARGPEGRVTDLYSRSRLQQRRSPWAWVALALLLAAAGATWFYVEWPVGPM